MTIYLDYNATTPLEPSVTEKIINSLKEDWGNPSSNYSSGIKAKLSINEARKNLALMIGAEPDDIIFTSGGTETNNMVIFGIINYYKEWHNSNSSVTCTSVRPHVITTNVEHDAVILPIKYLQEQQAIDVTIVPVLKTGCVTPHDIIAAIRPATCLITVILANNETGVIMPVQDIGRQLKEINEGRKRNMIKILYHTDAAQAIGKIKVDVEELLVDYLTIVGHKFYGPRVGCLYARNVGVQTPVYPLLHGGGQERSFRPGTENTAMIVGLGEAARLVCENLSTYSSQMKAVRDYLEQKLKDVFSEDSVVINCSENVERLPNTCNVSICKEGVTGCAVLSNCKFVIASVGAACHTQNKPSGILLASGVSYKNAVSAIRLSVGRETTKNAIDMAVEDLKQVVTKLYSNS